jgi:hypothetical protein
MSSQSVLSRQVSSLQRDRLTEFESCIYVYSLVFCYLSDVCEEYMYTVKPGKRGHHWGLAKVSSLDRCPLFRGTG